ncbi:hypothetical protein CQ12_28590 [Bradyrhizobium jicamae]|uniref:Uncharacterized protein n=1 Tax=Bradyrhizobium jicamae TaxID=280332 RepID=A0A0R3M4E8_9BRAD|nr:hypothetical protein CQ12_28590 [Bradyrhizobium jicamae]
MSKSRATGTAITTLLFCSAFQFFHSIGNAFETHPLAAYLLLEATLAMLIAIAMLTISTELASGKLRPLDLFFFLFPFTWLLLGSGFAWLAFDQPPIYGLSEERRILTFLYWFVLDPVRRKFGLTVSDLLLSLTLCASIYLVTAIGLQLAVPELLSGRALPDLDTRRLRMSSAGDCFAISFIIGVAGSLVSPRRTTYLVAAIVGLVGLVQVAQSRQLTLAAAITVLVLIFLLRPLWAMVVGLITIVAFLGTLSIRGPVVFSQILDTLLPNISEFFGSNLSDNPRINTLAIIANSLSENYFLGLGAVSLLYDGGLARLYGRNFFINDVGVMGEAFRVGLFYAIFVCAYAAMALRPWQRIDRMEHRSLVLGVYILYFLQAPTNGFFYRFGFVHAFLLLLMTAAGQHRKPSSAYLASPQPAASIR